jgi:hypothetical protein
MRVNSADILNCTDDYHCNAYARAPGVLLIAGNAIWLLRGQQW